MISNPEQNQQPLPNLPLASNDKFKTLFIVSIILLILAISVSIFLLLQNKKLSNNSQITVISTPTQSQSSISSTNVVSPSISPSTSLNQTSDWKTYTNRTYGYEVKYPSSWFVYVDKNGFGRDELRIEAKQRDVRSHIVDSDSLSVNIAKLNETKGTFFETGMGGTKESITISGVVGKRSDDGNGQSIFLQKDDFVYALQSYYQVNMSNSPVSPQNKQILDEIINSFKFISKVSSASNIFNPQSDWKTYTNSNYYYSIKYPKEWVFREFPDTKDGAGFRPLNKPNELRYEVINIAVMPRISNKNSSFEEYVKKYAINEADGRTNLAFSQKIITESGLAGFKNIYNSARGKDLIITYFDTKNANNDTIEISLNDENYLDLYNQMITTFQSTH